MKIHIDLVHLPNINFFKNLIHLFEKDGHEVILTVLNRGRLRKIIEQEFEGREFKVIGKHRGTLYSILFEANFFRFFGMFKYILKNKPDIAINVGSFPQEVSMGLLRKPNITIGDDVERKYDFFFHDIFATQVIFPPIIESRGKYKTFNALKEWAYLSPKYFTPNERVLERYNLNKFDYIFIREVSTGSMNYLKQVSGLVQSFSSKVPKDIKVLFSLEEKSKMSHYPKQWILLQEPVSDIHSLMYYSKIVISSGDSMAREGALLGVKSVYCGIREMRANNILIERNLLSNVTPEKVPDYVKDYYYGECYNDERRKILIKEWDDVNQYIVNLVNNYNN